ncbi:glycosyltransferase [Actinomycetota bacterium]
MKIALLTSIGVTLDAFFPPLVAEWRAAGHEVVTASAEHSDLTPHTELTQLTRRPSPKNLGAHREIACWLRAERADVLVTNTAVASFVARVRPQPCPVVYFCHGLHWNEEHSPGGRVWQLLERAALRNTDGVVTINSDDDDWFRRHLPGDRVARLHTGVGLPTTAYPRSPVPPVGDRVDLLWAGEFSQRKRPLLALEVMRAMRSALPSAHLTMCGSGELLDQTADRARKLDLAEYVSFPGHVTDLDERLTASHALLMTSSWEGLPRIGLEAIAVGRPVFAFDVKGVRSLPDVLLAHDSEPDQLARLIADTVERGLDGLVSTPHAQLDATFAAQELLTFFLRIGAVA